MKKAEYTSFVSLKIKLLFLFILLIPAKVNCLSNFSFSITPNTSIVFGTHDEKFYSSIIEKNVVSDLEWKIQPLWKIGINADVAINNFMISIGIAYALPLNCGEMHDSDFDPFSGMKYCYSINELKSNLNLNTNFDLSYKLNLSNLFYISPKVSVHYYYDNFYASNGYGWYGQENSTRPEVSWDDPRATYYEKGALGTVDFYRHSFFSFLGVALGFEYQRFSTDVEFLFSPYAYFYTMDHHLSKNAGYHFKQIQEGYFSHIFISGRVSYKITQKLVPMLEISHLSGKLLKGTLSSDFKSSDFFLTDQKSGGNINLTTFKIGLSINIL